MSCDAADNLDVTFPRDPRRLVGPDRSCCFAVGWAVGGCVRVRPCERDAALLVITSSLHHTALYCVFTRAKPSRAVPCRTSLVCPALVCGFFFTVIFKKCYLLYMLMYACGESRDIRLRPCEGASA